MFYKSVRSCSLHELHKVKGLYMNIFDNVNHCKLILLLILLLKSWNVVLLLSYWRNDLRGRARLYRTLSRLISSSRSPQPYISHSRWLDTSYQSVTMNMRIEPTTGMWLSRASRRVCHGIIPDRCGTIANLNSLLSSKDLKKKKRI